MKIYHTETQADYDALMVELEAKGCEWFSGRKPTEATTYWKLNSSETCVKIDKKVIAYNEKGYYAISYPQTPITKYKAKADEKMRFTKENVSKLFNEHDKYICFSINDLRDEILKLDDTPEKVAVPKFVADYLEERKRDGDRLVTSLYPYQGNSGELIEDWFEEEENNVSFARAWIYGYTIEPEQLYYVPLPHLETSDGIQQVLSQRKGDKNYFASRPAETLKQRYTKEELKCVPEIYKPYAKPIEEEEK